MKKLIIILLATILFAHLNKEVLLIEAKLYPKIIMLIDNFRYKKTIKIAIVANKQTYNYANFLKKLMQNKNFKINIIKKINNSYDVYILTHHINKNIINNLIKKKKVIFSVCPENINISMFSIYIGARVYPYLNPYLIKKANLKIDPIIFKVGKIYE